MRDKENQKRIRVYNDIQVIAKLIPNFEVKQGGIRVKYEFQKKCG